MWQPGKILHGGGEPGPLPAYVEACGPGLAPAMASNFLAVGKRNGGFAPVAAGLKGWLAGEKKAGRIPNIGFELHDIASDGKTRTSNCVQIISGERDAEFDLAFDALASHEGSKLVRFGLEVTSNGFESPMIYRQAHDHLAKRLRKRVPNVALCFCIEPSAPYGFLRDWMPKDVDCCGVDLYARETFVGPLVDGRGNLLPPGRAADMAKLAKEERLPFIIPECAPVGRGLKIGTTQDDADHVWVEWFVPWIAFMKVYGVSAFDFMSQATWGGSNGWGSSEIGKNPFLMQRYRVFLSKPQIVNAPF